MYVVTGLTKMNGNRVCMSVYDTENNCYKRPVFLNNNITEDTVRNITLFSIINLIPVIQPITVTAPHLEDLLVQYTTAFVEIGRLNPQEQLQLLNDIAFGSAVEMFSHQQDRPILYQYLNKFYVNPNTGNYSLGTIQAREAIFYCDNYNKIRVNFTDLSGAIFNDVPYMSIDQNEWVNPIQHINEFNLRRVHNIFVRLSLSRPFQPKNWNARVCFLQVSGIQTY